MDNEKNEKNKDIEPVTNGDYEFLVFLADAEDIKDKEDNFIKPNGIFKMLIEHSVSDGDFEHGEESEVVYNVYVVVDGMYYIVGTLDSYKSAKRFCENFCLKTEKRMKKNLADSLCKFLKFDFNEDIDDDDIVEGV